LKGLPKLNAMTQPTPQRRSFDSESAERRAAVRTRFICAELLGYADGIEFAISDAVDILIWERKIFPTGVAIPFFVVWRSQFF
jgi:hypothetical protein